MALTLMSRFVHLHMIPRSTIGYVQVGGSVAMDRSKGIKTLLLGRFETHPKSDVEGLDMASTAHVRPTETNPLPRPEPRSSDVQPVTESVICLRAHPAC